MTSTKEGGEITKFGGMLRMVVDGILGGEMFLIFLMSTKPKNKSLPFHHKFFLHFVQLSTITLFL